MQRLCILLSILVMLPGCSRQDKKPTPVVQVVNPGPPQHWTMEDFLGEYSLLGDADDFYAQFRETPGCSFGMVRARERLSARSHREHDLVLYVHSGNARFNVGGRDYTAVTGDVVYIPRGLKYSAESSDGNPLDFFTVYYPPFKGEDIIYHEPPAEKQ